MMNTLLNILSEIDKDNQRNHESHSSPTLYRVFRGNGGTGEETHPLFRGMPHPITVLGGDGILANTILCCKETAGEMLSLKFDEIVKITKDKKVIWQHPKYHMSEIKYRDVMRKQEASGEVKCIGENIYGEKEYRNSPLQIVDLPVFDGTTLQKDGYQRTRIFYLEKPPYREVYSFAIVNDKKLNGIDKITDNVIKYIKGERNKI